MWQKLIEQRGKKSKGGEKRGREREERGGERRKRERERGRRREKKREWESTDKGAEQDQST